MFVLADMEWVTNAAGHFSPTQLAATRVNENWNKIDSIDSFIRPRDSEFHEWEHVAYTGGTATDFIYARSAYHVFEYFRNWLKEDDVILWWYSESEELYEKFIKMVLKCDENHKMISINRHVYKFLAGQENSRGNTYRIAEARGIDVRNELKHNAKNDVRVMRELMAFLSYPQEKLLIPIPEPKTKDREQIPKGEELPYQYDINTNVIHKNGCEKLKDVETITRGYPSFKTALRKGFEPCECCKEEYREAFRERNIDIIERTEYTYLYTPDSDVFHKYTCGLMLNAKDIKGCRSYKTVEKTGKRPCKICNPTPRDKYKPMPAQFKEKRFRRKLSYEMSEQDSKAIKRQEGAAHERYEKLNNASLTEVERRDVYTLTQPGYAFWAAKGYQTFHLRSCGKLQELSHLKGFRTFEQATKAGYTPCKRCKPTAKHDVTLSVPITNRIRVDEKPEDIEVMCKDAGYKYRFEGAFIKIDTPVGKWRINMSDLPVKVDHINLVHTPNCQTYHKQHRIFLSLTDTFDYIKRHDEELEKKQQSERVYIKLHSKGQEW